MLFIIFALGLIFIAFIGFTIDPVITAIIVFLLIVIIWLVVVNERKKAKALEDYLKKKR